MTDTDAPCHAAAEPPTRTTNTINLAFGMLNLPTSLYAGTERAANAVPRSQFTKDTDHEVGMRPYDKVTGEWVERDNIVQKATASDGTRVELTDDEKAAIVGERDGVAAIETFIPVSALLDGTYVVESYHQLRAAKIKAGKKSFESPAAGKGLSLLLQAMEVEQVAALTRVSLRSGPRYAAVLPDGRVGILCFAEQIRAQRPFIADPVSEKELEMATALVRSVGVSTPVLTDETGAALQAYVDEKAAGAAPVEYVEPEPQAPVVDLMAALAASLGLDTPESEAEAVAVADEAIAAEVEPPAEDEPAPLVRPLTVVRRAS